MIFHHWLKKKKMLIFLPATPKKFENFCSSKISLWVLKRIVLTHWKRFLIFKIHQTSFRTRIRHVIQFFILFVNNVPYPHTERSQMNFIYQKTFSTCQEDSFKYPYWYFWRDKIFVIMMWNQLKNSFMTFIWKKCLIVFANFNKRSFLGTLLMFKKIFMWTTEFVSSRRFFIEKVGNLVNTQKFCHHRLNHSYIKG